MREAVKMLERVVHDSPMQLLPGVLEKMNAELGGGGVTSSTIQAPSLSPTAGPPQTTATANTAVHVASPSPATTCIGTSWKPITVHGPGRTYTYACPGCSETAASKNGMRGHINKEHLKRPLLCQYKGCDFSCYNPDQMSHHYKKVHASSCLHMMI